MAAAIYGPSKGEPSKGLKGVRKQVEIGAQVHDADKRLKAFVKATLPLLNPETMNLTMPPLNTVKFSTKSTEKKEYNKAIFIVLGSNWYVEHGKIESLCIAIKRELDKKKDIKIITCGKGGHGVGGAGDVLSSYSEAETLEALIRIRLKEMCRLHDPEFSKLSKKLSFEVEKESTNTGQNMERVAAILEKEDNLKDSKIFVEACHPASALRQFLSLIQLINADPAKQGPNALLTKMQQGNFDLNFESTKLTKDLMKFKESDPKGFEMFYFRELIALIQSYTNTDYIFKTEELLNNKKLSAALENAIVAVLEKYNELNPTEKIDNIENVKKDIIELMGATSKSENPRNVSKEEKFKPTKAIIDKVRGFFNKKFAEEEEKLPITFSSVPKKGLPVVKTDEDSNPLSTSYTDALLDPFQSEQLYNVQNNKVGDEPVARGSTTFKTLSVFKNAYRLLNLEKEKKRKPLEWLNLA
jgi:hypothetical protein